MASKLSGKVVVVPGASSGIDVPAGGAPTSGDMGAHGRFDARARRWSTERWLREHRGALAVAAAAAFGALALRTGPERSLAWRA